MGKYVVIDTNVLVSALITRNENSPTVKILHLLTQNKIIPVYSAEIINEYITVLRREKFKLPDEIIVKVVNDIIENGFEIKNIAAVKEKLPDEKDVVFYAVTLSARDREIFLVTGNGKYFPEKPYIVTPAELVEIIEND